MSQPHSSTHSQPLGISAHWSSSYDEAGIQAWAEATRSHLDAPEVSLGIVFVSPEFFDHAEELLEVLRVHARIPLLLGCSGAGWISGPEEYEHSKGLVLTLLYLPEAILEARHLTSSVVESWETTADVRRTLGIQRDKLNDWLVLGDPFHLNVEEWLNWIQTAYPGIPIAGGLASGTRTTPRTQVYLNGEVHEEGLVLLGIGGKVALETLVSQGCTPFGEAWTITQTERNLIHRIGNRPAYELMMESCESLPPKVRLNLRGNLFLGLVMDEYHEAFQRGDFLVRNILAGDPKSGCLAVGALPSIGQTVQFQRRDADAAREDLRHSLDQVQRKLAGRPVHAGLLFCCAGRGRGLYQEEHVDASTIWSTLEGPPLAGFFCNGEIGPVGSKSFVHGYTAVCVLFTSVPSGT